MIIEIDSSEIIAYIAIISQCPSIKISYSELRRIGNYVEEEDHELRVNLDDWSINRFCRCSFRNFSYDGTTLLIRNIESQQVKRIVELHKPSDRISSLISNYYQNDQDN